LDHAVVSKAVARFENRMRVDQQLRRQVATVHF
jgi:hypothetical protein